MIFSIRHRLVPLFALTVLLAAFPAGAAEIVLLAPAQESFLQQEKLLVIGKVEGFTEAERVEVRDNGKVIGYAPLKKGVFLLITPLVEGKHQLEFAAPGVKRQRITVFRGRQQGYRYHLELDEGYCAKCHPGADRGEYHCPRQVCDVCSQCHDRMDRGNYVHGPVAAGSCSPCHDPHGSRYDSFLKLTGKALCLMCHSQGLSARHVEERANADCLKCHDPHESEGEFHLR